MANKAIDALRNRLAGAVKAVVKSEQATIERAISVPVGRDFAGNVIQRSKPGQPPRMETGQLHANIDTTVELFPREIVGTIRSSRPETPEVPAKLEFGDPSENLAARPYMRPAVERLKETAKKRILEAMK